MSNRLPPLPPVTGVIRPCLRRTKCGTYRATSQVKKGPIFLPPPPPPSLKTEEKHKTRNPVPNIVKAGVAMVLEEDDRAAPRCDGWVGERERKRATRLSHTNPAPGSRRVGCRPRQRDGRHQARLDPGGRGWRFNWSSGGEYKNGWMALLQCQFLRTIPPTNMYKLVSIFFLNIFLTYCFRVFWGGGSSI